MATATAAAAAAAVNIYSESYISKEQNHNKEIIEPKNRKQSEKKRKIRRKVK